MSLKKVIKAGPSSCNMRGSCAKKASRLAATFIIACWKLPPGPNAPMTRFRKSWITPDLPIAENTSPICLPISATRSMSRMVPPSALLKMSRMPRPIGRKACSNASCRFSKVVNADCVAFGSCSSPAIILPMATSADSPIFWMASVDAVPKAETNTCRICGTRSAIWLISSADIAPLLAI